MRSLRRLVAHALLTALEEHAPGVSEVVREVEAWAVARDPIEPPAPTREAVESTEGEGVEGDTLVVEITDDRGRVVGYTTARRLKE